MLEINLPDEIVARIDLVGDRSEFVIGAVIRMLAEIQRRNAAIKNGEGDDVPELPTGT